MRKLAVGALLIGLVVACSSKSNPKIIDAPPGGGSDSGTAACNPLTQTGCNVDEKCTWIEDATMPQPLGHIGCAPVGSVARGGACMYGMPGATGYDNCGKGDVCVSRLCKQICDPNGGMPTCGPNFSCGTYDGLFGPSGSTTPPAAGACDPTCNPLDDNKFGKATRAGSACAANQGCYGGPERTPTQGKPVTYTCVGEVNAMLTHRMACTQANGCQSSGGGSYLNGCASGFMPLFYDATGSMNVICNSICRPGDCYQGHCGTASANLGGDAAATPRHQCNNTDSAGQFNVATAANNGDQCFYFWLYEVDANQKLVRSPWSDITGYCRDHAVYKYDPTGGMNPNTSWPKCDTFATPGFGSGSAFGAADFGCVSSATAGQTLDGKVERYHVLDMPRPSYTMTAKQVY